MVTASVRRARPGDTVDGVDHPGSTPSPAPSRLGSTTWTALDQGEGAPPVIVVPVGSCEQHGPHLPIATDTLIAEALSARLVTHLGAAGRRALIAPSLTITASGEHQGFAGTLSIGTEAMRLVIIELVRSADWSAGVVLVNGHGGNYAPVTSAVERSVAEGRSVLAWWPVVPGGDPHAGAVETSIMLAVHPELVDMPAAVAGPVPSIAELRSTGVQALSPSGVLGDPCGADAATGIELLAGLTADLVAAVERWWPQP